MADKNSNVKEHDLSGDFFGIEQQCSRANRHWHVLAVLIFIIFAWWVWMLNPTPQIHGDQINVVTMVLSEQHPENFTKDPVWNNSAGTFYPPVFRAITSYLIDKWGVIGGHRVVQFPLEVAFLLSMYFALYYITRSVPASILVACISLIWRNSLGGTYWGLDRLQAVQPRSFATIFIPILFVMIWKLRNSWRLLIPFFVLGLLFNLNPPSSLFFTGLIWTSLVLTNLKKRQILYGLAVSIPAFLLGALPYFIVNVTARTKVSANLSPAELQQFMQALQYRFSQTSWFPISASQLSTALLPGFAVPVLIATVAWCLRSGKRTQFDSWLNCVILLAFFPPVLIQYILQKLYVSFQITPILANCMRAQKFVYLALYIYMAWLLAEYLRKFKPSGKVVLITIVVVITIMLPLFGSNNKDPWGQWNYNSGQAKALFGGKKIEIAGWHQSIAGIANWARQNTPKDSLFLFVHPKMDPFRIYALRSIVTSQGSGGMALFNGPKKFINWMVSQNELNMITSKNDLPGLLKLAGKSGADYIITQNDFPRVTGWNPVAYDRYWVVYALKPNPTGKPVYIGGS